MADFTYTDRNKKVVLHSWGRHRATVMEAVVVGDLVSRYVTDNAYTYQFADESDSQAAEAVALEDIAAAGTGWFALAAELKAPVSVGAGGAVTRTYFAEAADFLGKPLYLSTTGGKASSAEGGSLVQLVGCLLARDRILLTPGGGLLTGAGVFSTITASGLVAVSDATEATGPTDGSLKTAGGMGVAKKLYVGTNLDIAGTAVIDGTLTQTGIATFAALPVFTVGVSIPANKTIKMAVTDHGADGAITPSGAHTISKGSAAAMTLAAPTAGEIVIISAKTAHAHVITCDGAVKWNGTNDTATLGGAIGDCIIAIGISATLWAIIAQENVTLSSS